MPTSVPTRSVYTVLGLTQGMVKNGGLAVRVGTVEKHPSPLLVQDQPWEPRLDNGYPNVIPPSAATASWQLFYGDCVSGCGTQILLYANSTDGMVWHKPKLGLFDVGTVRPDLSYIGKANNIVLEGGGIGVRRDEQSGKYVAFGPACYDAPRPGANPADQCHIALAGHPPTRWQASNPTQDLAFSDTGLIWRGARDITWPPPQRYDCHNNLFFDAPSQRYVATTRDGFSQAPGRTIGIAVSPSAKLTFNTSEAPACTLAGTSAKQLYSQITFRWHDVLLGIVMVYDAQDAAQKVRCKLAWAPAAHGKWRWVEGDEASGPDFVPLGKTGAFDSHICFAAASPVAWADGAVGSPSGRVTHERIYYMGGNGPHSGARNSSLGLAKLRKDGYAGVGGSGKIVLLPVRCTHEMLTVTYDAAERGGGSIRIGLADVRVSPGLSVNASIPLTHSATDAIMHFAGGCGGPDFTPLIGQDVTLAVQMTGGTLYTVGFTKRPGRQPPRGCRTLRTLRGLGRHLSAPGQSSP